MNPPLSGWLAVRYAAAMASRGNRPMRSTTTAYRMLFLLALGLPAFAALPSAQAQTAEAADSVARSLFDEGVQAFAEARYETALDRFRIAHQLSRRPGLLYNIGLTEDRLRHDREALEAFERFLAESPATETRRGEVERRVIILRESIAERERIEADRARAAAEAERASETARQAEAERDAHARLAAEREAHEGDSITHKWWFWTTIGAVVAAGVAVPVIMSQNQAPPPRYYPSDTGGTIFALRR